MPAVLREVDYLFALSIDDPVSSWSMIAAEAEASGCEIIRDAERLIR
jgi:hypothetical protein